MQSSDAFIPKYSELIYNGFWFLPEREALQALITETQRHASEVVSLYDPKIATMEGEKSRYDQSDATGFICLNALRLKLRAAVKTSAKG
jgi:argininosuccinate synthase